MDCCGLYFVWFGVSVLFVMVVCVAFVLFCFSLVFVVLVCFGGVGYSLAFLTFLMWWFGLTFSVAC